MGGVILVLLTKKPYLCNVFSFLISKLKKYILLYIVYVKLGRVNKIYNMLKEKELMGLMPYEKPEVELIALPECLSFLEEGFSGTFLPDEIDLDGMEGDETDNF